MMPNEKDFKTNGIKLPMLISIGEEEAGRGEAAGEGLKELREVVAPLTFLTGYISLMATLHSGKQAAFYKWFLEEAIGYTKNNCRPKGRNDVEAFGEIIKFRECYYNAQVVAYTAPVPGITYVEGWVAEPAIGLPMEHAFNVLGEKCFDFTARLHWSDQPLAWLGVEVPGEILEQYRAFIKVAEGAPITPLQYYYRYHIAMQ